jgi:hypothetical protein
MFLKIVKFRLLYCCRWDLIPSISSSNNTVIKAITLTSLRFFLFSVKAKDALFI